MSPRRVEQDPWPWPGDTPLDRARRVARTYRDVLAKCRPDACVKLDRHTEALGQSWIVPRPVEHTVDDLLTAEQVAEMCDVQIGTVTQWRRRGLRVTATVDGRRYRVSDVLDYHALRRRRRGKLGKTA